MAALFVQPQVSTDWLGGAYEPRIQRRETQLRPIVHRTTRQRRGSLCCVRNEGYDRKPLSRREALAVAFGLAMSTTVLPPQALAQPPRRTIFDEERELNEKLQRESEEERLGALRAGFDAVVMASAQLDDLQKLAEDEEWDRVREFARLFNNSVEREGMEAVARKIRDKQIRKAALALCRQVTESLIAADQSAGQKDRERALGYIQQTRELISKFQDFKP